MKRAPGLAPSAPATARERAALAVPAPLPRSAPQEASAPGFWRRSVDAVTGDYAAFYDGGTLLALGAGVGLGALAANTRFDGDVRDGVQEHWRSPKTDDARKVVTWFGEGEVLLPVFALSAWLGDELGAEPVAAWGQRAVRATLVAAPPLLALQRVTGASRPDDPANQHGSKWVFWNDANGVSGHATLGAITFLSLAQETESPWLDGLCYAASALPALARVQADRHYASQAALGWLLGFLAVEAVDDHERARGPRTTTWLPVYDGDGVGFTVVHRF